MFCPECNTEYRTGFYRCADCGVDLVDRAPKPEAVEDEGPVVVFVTADSNEAALVKSLLEGSGIEAWALDENLSRMDSPIAIVIGGIKIAVPRDQEELAREVLVEYRGRAGQDPAHGRLSAFASAEMCAEGDEGSSNVEEYRCSHCSALLEAEVTVCPKCGREPW